MEQELVDAYRATPLRLGQGATGRAAETRTPYQIADLRQEQEFATRGMRPILFRLGYQSLLAVPLLLDQKDHGSFDDLPAAKPAAFAPEVVNLLQTFATQSVLAIHNARLFREIEDKEPGDRSGQSAQVGVSRQRVARAAHAAQRDHRLLGSVGRENVRRAE